MSMYNVSVSSGLLSLMPLQTTETFNKISWLLLNHNHYRKQFSVKQWSVFKTFIILVLLVNFTWYWQDHLGKNTILWQEFMKWIKKTWLLDKTLNSLLYLKIQLNSCCTASCIFNIIWCPHQLMLFS